MTKQLTMLVALLSFWTAGAQAVPVVYMATLNAASENPANASPGTGTATVTYDSTAHTLLVQVTFSGLDGTTTAAHIHCCAAAPTNVGVATETPTFAGFPLGVTSGSYTDMFDLTLTSSFNGPFVSGNGGTAAGAEAALAAGMAAGQAYLNIHTSQHSGGEIRGYLVPVPEPANAALLAAGIGTLMAARRKKLV